MSEIDVAKTNAPARGKKQKSAKPATKSKTAAAKPSRSRKKPAAINISDEQRLSMIAETAYFKAEKRGFMGGDPTEDWLAAESEVEALLSDNPAQQASA
ncbi:MAG: DUF2934 domain-containing protein [Gammaproteobacteria bacterium]|jgi:hypothetical protein|nr:DUF2934 domain-containing protein [Gammaproteobacteria bacterium]